MKLTKFFATALVTLVACTTTQSLPPRFHPIERPTPERAIADTIAAAAKPAPSVPALAVGVTTAPARLIAWDAQGKLLWQTPIEARSAPLIAGSAVVIAEPQGVVVRDLVTGATRVTLDDHGVLVGADGGEREVVIAIDEQSAEAGAAGGGFLVFVDGDNVRWRQHLGLPLGVPAWVKGGVLVPWATQRLSILDSKDGQELARLQATRAVFGHALVRHGRAYVGQHRLWPLSAELPEAGAKGFTAANTPTARVLPGQPPLLRDGYAAVPDPGHAYHRLRLDWDLTQDGRPVGDALFLHFYRLLFAFDAQSETPRWVKVLDRDVVGAEVVARGLIVADAAGTLRLVGQDGAEQTLVALGQPLQVVALSAPERWVAAAPAAPKAELPSLETQLAAVAALDDPRLTEGRAYAVQRLSALPGGTVTARLVELCSRREHPDSVRRAACDGLAERPDGSEAILSALRLAVNAAPPVSPLARAAVRMQLKRAAPLLVPYVNDIRTAAIDLPVVIRALAALEYKPAAEPIERFLRIHHAEPDGSDLGDALRASTEALASLRAPHALPTLSRVATDGFAQDALRASAQQAIVELKSPPKPKPKPAAPAAAAAKAETPSEAAAAAKAADTRPAELSPQLVDAALAPLRAKLMRCVQDAPGKAPSSRVVLQVGADGKVERAFVTPDALQACIEPIVRTASFPVTRAGRQQVKYLVRAPAPGH